MEYHDFLLKFVLFVYLLQKCFLFQRKCVSLYFKESCKIYSTLYDS